MNIIFVQYLQNESIIVSSLWPDKLSVMTDHLPITHARQTNFPKVIAIPFGNEVKNTFYVHILHGSWTYLHNLLRLSLTHSLPHNSLTHSLRGMAKGGDMAVRTPHHWP